MLPAPLTARGSSSLQTSRHSHDEYLGIYIHFPWCLRKCPYCDFLSIARGSDEIPREAYTMAVQRELEQRSASLEGARVRSVFFGGGTPSLWGGDEIGKVLGTIRKCYRFTETPVEISVECNPTSFSREVGMSLRDHGVGRISLGVQSLDSERLRFLGRLHDVDGGLRALQAALDVGFAEVSADLIFGVHGQTPEQARSEVGQLADMGVTHLSAYALTIEPGTQFGALHRKGRLPLLPDDTVADSFTAVHDALTSRGYDHYEISNFCRPGHPAQHNLGYWRGQPYLGIGCGAWGTLPRADERAANDEQGPLQERVRYRNTPSAERYMALSHWPAPALEHGGPGKPYDSVETLDAETLLLERLMLGLRLSEGVNLEALETELNVEVLTPKRLKAIERLARNGRVLWDGRQLSIPTEQWLLADGLIAQLA